MRSVVYEPSFLFSSLVVWLVTSLQYLSRLVLRCRIELLADSSDCWSCLFHLPLMSRDLSVCPLLHFPFWNRICYPGLWLGRFHSCVKIPRPHPDKLKKFKSRCLKCRTLNRQNWLQILASVCQRYHTREFLYESLIGYMLDKISKWATKWYSDQWRM